jgi:aryl-alcohol dehydrogenase-like predicted oxidoreductase
LRFCKEHGIGVIPWSPLAGGWLTGKYRKGKAAPEDSRGGRRGWELETPTAKAKLDAVEALIDIADGCDATLSQFALAWVLANPVVTAPIIGPRTVDQLEDNLGALDVSVTADIRKAVDDVVAPGADLTGHAGII